MQTLRDALLGAGIVTARDVRRENRGAQRREEQRRARKHRDLASRKQDAQMSEQEIADEMLRHARVVR